VNAQPLPGFASPTADVWREWEAQLAACDHPDAHRLTRILNRLLDARDEMVRLADDAATRDVSEALSDATVTLADVAAEILYPLDRREPGGAVAWAAGILVLGMVL
jgi:hypothetical protein